MFCLVIWFTLANKMEEDKYMSCLTGALVYIYNLAWTSASAHLLWKEHIWGSYWSHGTDLHQMTEVSPWVFSLPAESWVIKINACIFWGYCYTALLQQNNHLIHHPGFNRWASGKEPACQCRRNERLKFDPWDGKIPWRRAWQPTPESHGQRSLTGDSPQDYKKLDMTEAT